MTFGLCNMHWPLTVVWYRFTWCHQGNKNNERCIWICLNRTPNVDVFATSTGSSACRCLQRIQDLLGINMNMGRHVNCSQHESTSVQCISQSWRFPQWDSALNMAVFGSPKALDIEVLLMYCSLVVYALYSPTSVRGEVRESRDLSGSANLVKGYCSKYIVASFWLMTCFAESTSSFP